MGADDANDSCEGVGSGVLTMSVLVAQRKGGLTMPALTAQRKGGSGTDKRKNKTK